MIATVSIGINDYSNDEFKRFLNDRPKFSLSAAAAESLASSHGALMSLLSAGDQAIYGVNTGFGTLSQVAIPSADLEILQANLIRSHSAGMGAPLDADVVRLTMLLKVLSLVKGYSGVRPVIAERLLALLNGNCLPVIPAQGSVGASGDLAPLAHMTLVLMGEGEAYLNGRRVGGDRALKDLSLEPLTLQAKEGVALINGTQVSTALGLVAVSRLQNLIRVVDIVGALSVDGLLGSRAPFLPEVHRLKNHAGQRISALNLYLLMEGSTIMASHRDCDKVQDIYSLRCMPQVHGACRDLVEFAAARLVDEANSVSDNPLVFATERKVLSAGHFHGEAAGLACDTAALAATELGNISERRIFALCLGKDDLPPFLAPDPGLNSGFMMAQVTAAALASENRTLAHPATADNIPTGAGHEDHVPHSNWAGRKLLQMVDNVESVLAIEFLAAAQAVDLRKGLRPGKGAEAALRLLREHVPAFDVDRLMTPDIERAKELIASGDLVKAVEQVVELQ